MPKLMKNTKRRLAVFLVVICLLSMTNLCVFATSYSHSPKVSTLEEGHWKYTISGSNATIIGYTGTDTLVTTPTTIDGYTVIAIGTKAFAGINTVETLIISEGVVTIADESIMSCPKLKEIRFPATFKPSAGSTDGTRTGLSFVPEYCPKLETVTVAAGNPYLTVHQGDLYNKDMTTLLFHPTASTATTLEIPSGVTNIASTACKDSLSLEKVVIPDTVTYVGYWAFAGCTNLTEIKVSANCQIIDQYAFHQTAITELNLPATLTEFNLNDLSLPNLTVFVVAENNSVFSSENGVLYNADKTKLLLFPMKKEGDFTVPESVLTIEAAAFHEEGVLSSVTIPYQVLGIGKDNFNKDCQIKGYTGSAAEAYAKEQEMTFVSLGTTPVSIVASGTVGNNLNWTLSSESVLTISGTGTMEIEQNTEGYYDAPWLPYKDAIRRVVIESGVTNIGNSAFKGCENLESIIIPDTVVSFESEAFYSCTKLKNITLPENLSSIGDYVFVYCEALESIHIPAKLTSGLDGSDFQRCAALEKITVSDENTAYKAMDGILYSKNGETLIRYPEKRGVQKYLVEDFVKNIGDYAFSDTIIWTVILPDSVTNLGEGAFADSTVSHVELGNGISSILKDTFYSCQGLLCLFVKSSLKNVSESGFPGCYSLEEIYYEGSKASWSEITFGTDNEAVLSATKHYNVSDEEVHTVIGHICEQPTWTWADDCSEATASLTCAICKHTWDETVSTEAEYVPATENEDAKIIYKAVVYVDVEEFVGVKVVYGSDSVLGDVSGDNVVNAQDALLILKNVAGMEVFSTKQKTLADVTGDKIVNAEDALNILKFVANMITKF